MIQRWILSCALALALSQPAFAEESFEIDGYDASFDEQLFASGDGPTDDMYIATDSSSPANSKPFDPLEPLNRFIYSINQTLNVIVFRPLVDVYRHLVPEPAQEIVSNAVLNISEPVTAVNAMFQGDVDQATDSFGRFLVNSTLGLGGMFDVAKEAGLAHRKSEDFGQTLGTLGVEQGPYLVLPVIGPTTIRDGAGTIVDVLMNPVTYALAENEQIVRGLVTGFNAKEQFIDQEQQLEDLSLDPYSALRSLYFQYRDFAVTQ